MKKNKRMEDVINFEALTKQHIEGLEKTLQDNLVQIKKTSAKPTDEHLMPDFKRFRLSHMVIGAVTETHEVLNVMERMNYVLDNFVDIGRRIDKEGKGKFDDSVGYEHFKMVMKDFQLEIGDLFWYILNYIPFIQDEDEDVSQSVKFIHGAVAMVDDTDKEEFIVGNTLIRMEDILDKAKKYLFQFHDLKLYQKDFNTFMQHLIGVVMVAIASLNELGRLINDDDLDFSICNCIEMVADKLEKRYEGGEFDAKKSMERKL